MCRIVNAAWEQLTMVVGWRISRMGEFMLWHEYVLCVEDVSSSLARHLPLFICCLVYVGASFFSGFLLGIATFAICGSVRGVLGSDCIALLHEGSAIVWRWLFLLVVGLRMAVWGRGGVLLWSKIVLVGGELWW